MNLKIVSLPISQVRPYENNPRENKATIEALKRAIARYGFNQPIVVDQEYVIVKGHSRYFAAKGLGMKEIPAIITDASPEMVRADRIADNMIHDLSEWNMDSLHAEMRDVEDAISEILHSSYADAPGGSPVSVDVSTKKVELSREAEASRAKKQKAMIEIPCQKCGSSFYVDKKYVEKL